MGVWYCTLDDVKRALSEAETSRSDAQISRAIASSSTVVEDNCNRVFYPTVATRYFDWPNFDRTYGWKLYFGSDEVISLSAFTSGGVSLAASDYILQPVNLGPPYLWMELDLGIAGSFNSATTRQNSLAATGLFGYRNDEMLAGTASALATTTATALTVSDSSAIGVGSLLRIDSERLIVTGKSMITTGQTLQTPVSALTSDTTIAVTLGSAYAVGEIILLDAERMLIVDIAGNNLLVRRAWDGTVLAAHTGSTIYAPRALTVTRGQLGTTAATHASSAPINLFLYPALVRDLTLGLAMVQLQQERSGYARGGAGENARSAVGVGIEGMICATVQAHGRRARLAAI